MYYKTSIREKMLFNLHTYVCLNAVRNFNIYYYTKHTYKHAYMNI